jgi:2-dehydro-3-deoxygluconokinase
VAVKDLPKGQAAGDGPVVVTVGEAMCALSCRGQRLEDADRYAVHVAGAEFNYAVDLCRLGVPARLFGAVGDDPFGRRIQRTARREGVDVAGLRTDPARPTGLLLKDLAGVDGERPVHYLRARSAAAAYGGGPDLEAAAGGAAGVHVTGISLVVGRALERAALRLLEAAPARAWRSFDLNVRLRLAKPGRWREVLELAVSRANVLFATAAELATIGVDPEAVARRCAASGVVAVLRLPGHVSEATLPDGTSARGAAPVGLASGRDPVGAGDAFAAAVTAWRLAGRGWPEALAAGHVAGAMTARTEGDFEGAPYRHELEALLAATHVNR